MASKPVFMRPVEITSTLADLNVRDRDSGTGWTTVTIDTGVYSSMQAVLYAFENQINDDIATMTTAIAFVDDGNGEMVIKFTFTDTTLGGNIDPDGTAIAELWGTTDTAKTDGASITLEYRPQYIWLPAYQVAVQTRFSKRQKDLFKGAQAKTGQLAGVTTGPDIYYRDLEFHNETAENLFDEAATTTATPDMQTRNLNYFAQHARTSQPSTSSLPSTKGFWYWNDWNDAIDNPYLMPGDINGTGSSREGINFDKSSTPSLFAFCQFEPDGFNVPQDVGVPTGRTYFNAKFQIHTISETPTWADPGGGGG